MLDEYTLLKKGQQKYLFIKGTQALVDVSTTELIKHLEEAAKQFSSLGIAVPKANFSNNGIGSPKVNVRSKQPIKGYMALPLPKKRETIIIRASEGEGTITVTKIIDNNTCALGYSSGDVVFYSLVN